MGFCFRCKLRHVFLIPCTYFLFQTFWTLEQNKCNTGNSVYFDINRIFSLKSVQFFKFSFQNRRSNTILLYLKMILEKNITSKTEFLYIKEAQQNINIRSTLDFKTVINRLYTIIYWRKTNIFYILNFGIFNVFIYSSSSKEHQNSLKMAKSKRTLLRQCPECQRVCLKIRKSCFKIRRSFI